MDLRRPQIAHEAPQLIVCVEIVKAVQRVAADLAQIYTIEIIPKWTLGTKAGESQTEVAAIVQKLSEL